MARAATSKVDGQKVRSSVGVRAGNKRTGQVGFAWPGVNGEQDMEPCKINLMTMANGSWQGLPEVFPR